MRQAGSLSLTVLPWYALLSIGRMLVVYTLSLLFTLPMVMPLPGTGVRSLFCSLCSVC